MQIEVLAARMRPTCGFYQRFVLPIVQPLEAGIAIGLQDAAEALQMSPRALPFAIRRVAEQNGRWIRTAGRLIIADIMRWTVPALIRCRKGTQQTEAADMTTMTIGLDISKSWFQIHGVTEDGEVIKKKLARGKVLEFFSQLSGCVVGLEACGSSHHWARQLIRLGHDARLMPARYVRAYVKTNKHDAADAEACHEAVQRPGMRFVPVKTVDQQGMLIVHRARDLLTRQRTGAVNALRGHLAEFGIVAAKGIASARALMELVGTDAAIPDCARSALSVLVEQIRDTEAKIERYSEIILATARGNEVCRRLMTVTTIGPFAATAIAATVGDPKQFSSARHFAAWLGLVPMQHSTGGKARLGGISKRGDAYIRKLLVHGARGAVHRVRSHQVKNSWITQLLERRPFNVATVALANKTARIAWAIMAHGEQYRAAA
jgi:transposase